MNKEYILDWKTGERKLIQLVDLPEEEEMTDDLLRFGVPDHLQGYDCDSLTETMRRESCEEG